MSRFAFVYASFAWFVPSYAFAVEVPKCVDPSLLIELVASEPEIVTPVSCRFDARGRLFVVESHTHFPPENYDGPKTDRVKIFDDTDGNGTLDRMRIFHEGTVKTMGMEITDDGAVFLSTRFKLLRIRDTDGDDIADETTTLVSLDTKADYPHNGLSGLLVEDTITFGMGENFGEPYTLRGSDASEQVGGGEGGNIFRCDLDGANLRRIATGFWNPFGLCRDKAGRLLMVDNDADAMPPCRIVNVQKQGDYGFQFRFGRAGTHPLQAWDGELPGTLGMVAGTGEAPCAITSYRGQYWVTSWGDNRIERYTPVHKGDSIQATRDVAVLGDAMFRPVDMAVATDGSMYVTDWVDRSYNVHRKGRIWRVQFSAEAAVFEDLALSAQEPKKRDEAEPIVSPGPLSSLMLARWNTIAASLDDSAKQTRQTTILDGLGSDDEDVRLAAVRWAAETGDKRFLTPVQSQFDRESLSPRMVGAVAAAISYLETGKVEKGGFDALTRQSLVNLASDKSKGSKLRQSALRLVPPDSPQWSLDALEAIAKDNDPELSREAVRHLAVAASSNKDAAFVVAKLLKWSGLSSSAKADLKIASTKTDPTSSPAIRPAKDDLDAWMKLVGDGGDAEKGWQVFFDAGAGKCSSCHARDGRGAGVGPDLTSLAGNVDRKRLLDSILHPSREIGPMYTTWKVLTTDGRVIAGLKLNGGGVGQSALYLLADSTTVDVPLEEIETQESSELSIMPDGLEQSMSIDQLRDLLAYLSEQ